MNIIKKQPHSGLETDGCYGEKKKWSQGIRSVGGLQVSL